MSATPRPRSDQYSSGDLGWPLRRAAQLHADRVAVLDGERSITYAQLHRRTAALGTALDGLGVGPGERVGILARNSLAHLEAWLAVPAYGRVVVDLNYRLSEDELVFMARDAELELLLTDDDGIEVARRLREHCSSLRELVHHGSGPTPTDCLAHEELATGEPAAPIGIASEHDLAAISYTGGTTGSPKGVMLSHRNLLANARHNLIATGHRAEHRFLHVCPMFHVAGTANVHACTWAGSLQAILPRFAPGPVARAIERERITHTVLVPTMLAMLLDDPVGRRADLSSLEHIQYAASPISPELQRRVLSRFPCDVAQFYGMTEAAPTVAHCTPEDHRRGAAGEEPYRARLASMGAPVIGVEVEVRGADLVELPPGEVGEVWVRGPNVMLGYWNRFEATQAALVDGWYRTGDAARRDADGYLYMVDRLRDMIISGGENVYSIEVEATLAEHDGVLEAAVFGIPHARWGEAVHAAVTVRPGSVVTAEELIEHCRSRIAGFKIPRSIRVGTEPLPRSGAGKVLKHHLREPHWVGQERRVS